MPDDLVGQQWLEEYSRVRKLGVGDYWAGCRLQIKAARSKISPFNRGVADHLSLRAATSNGRPPYVCPFAEDTPEKVEYERGWCVAAATSVARGR
jgi:hypothetical protein